MSPRRKSIDSSEDSYTEEESESGGSEYGDYHKKPKDKKDKKDKKDQDKKDKSKDKKEKKDKDKDKKDKDKKKDDHKSKTPSHTDISGGYAGSSVTHGAAPVVPQFPSTNMSYNSPPDYESEHRQQHFGGQGQYQDDFRGGGPRFPDAPSHHAPPSGPPPPPSGYRIPLTTQGSFPDRDQTGAPPFLDADGVSGVFIGSALMERSVHPCKIGPHLYQFCSVAYGGAEQAHNGRFDLLPFKPQQMEWVRTANGQVPPGRRPVEGGYEESGSKLYHAVANVNGVMVPGKTGEHLGGANVAFGGSEHVFTDNYEILCWR